MCCKRRGAEMRLNQSVKYVKGGGVYIPAASRVPLIRGRAKTRLAAVCAKSRADLQCSLGNL
jgi:hypothetical protein